MRALLPVLLAACSADLPPPADDPADLATCEGGEEHVALVTSLRIARVEGGVADGFDLDGSVTATGDPTGCGVADQVGPSGTEGIDNAFANLVPALESTEALALEPLVQTAINAGGMLVLLRWSGQDDPEDDACVTMASLNGTGPVFLGADERLLPWQTVDVDPTLPPSVAPQGAIRDGVLEAGPLDILVSVEVLRADVDMPLRDGRVRMEPDGEGGWRGVVGGGIALADLMAIADIPEVDDIVGQLLGAILTPMADLVPDENGACTHISFAAEFEAVPVFLYEGAGLE